MYPVTSPGQLFRPAKAFTFGHLHQPSGGDVVLMRVMFAPVTPGERPFCRERARVDDGAHWSGKWGKRGTVGVSSDAIESNVTTRGGQ